MFGAEGGEIMNTDDWIQASEEARLKMLNCCYMPSNDSMPSTADIFMAIMLIKRIEQLEGELTKHGIEIPEWKELLNNG